MSKNCSDEQMLLFCFTHLKQIQLFKSSKQSVCHTQNTQITKQDNGLQDKRNSAQLHDFTQFRGIMKCQYANRTLHYTTYLQNYKTRLCCSSITKRTGTTTIFVSTFQATSVGDVALGLASSNPKQRKLIGFQTGYSQVLVTSSVVEQQNYINNTTLPSCGYCVVSNNVM